MSKHEFALYSAQPIKVIHQSAIMLDDPELVKRIGSILRMNVGDSITLFDSHVHARVTIDEIQKKHIRTRVESILPNEPLQPQIHWLLPLLERDAFENAFSVLTVLGATSITPLITTKTHKKNLYLKDFDRLNRVMIAAAEQSKQFVLPAIHPLTDITALQPKTKLNIFFEPTGIEAQEIITQAKPNKTITCLIGPEGDLTMQEKANLAQQGFQAVQLSQSILRAEVAATVGMGILRSFLR